MARQKKVKQLPQKVYRVLLRNREEVASLVAQCKASGSDCTNLTLCIGASCAFIGGRHSSANSPESSQSPYTGDS